MDRPFDTSLIGPRYRSFDEYMERRHSRTVGRVAKAIRKEPAGARYRRNQSRERAAVAAAVADGSDWQIRRGTPRSPARRMRRASWVCP